MQQKLITTLLIFLMISSLSFAQEEATETTEEETEETASLSFSGSVDAYFRQNLSTTNISGSVPGSSFANLPGFALGMVNIVGAYEGKKAGVVADLVFGPRGSDAVFGSPAYSSTGQIINQLYAYWNVSDKVTFTIGNFNTFLGYEVISPTANFNYSTSYMFSYGPFSHTGAKADFALSDNLSLMLGIFNPTDATEFNPGNTYTLGGQLGYSGDNASVYLNLLYGDQDGVLDEDNLLADASAGATFQVDLTAGFDLTDALYFGLNTTYNATSAGEVVVNGSIQDADGDAAGFAGLAGYLQYSASDAFAIGVRGEYFSEFEFGAGAIGGYDDEGAANVIALTLSANAKVGGLTLIPEIRIDSASEDVFLDGDYMPSGSLASFVLGAVYGF